MLLSLILTGQGVHLQGQRGKAKGHVMIRRFAIAFLLFGLAAVPVSGQSLSPEDISKIVDQRMNDLNPYQILLNDPDPDRSRLAMQVMLESGDTELVRMALEFGLLSPNPGVKRTAFEAWLKTSPILSFRFDGTDIKDTDFENIVKGYWNGTISDSVGYWRIAVATFIDEKKCYSNDYRPNECFITVNSDGVFLTPDRLNARAVISEAGRLEGAGTMYAVDEPVPFTIQLVD